MDKKIELEAEMGRLFVQIERLKHSQIGCTDRINQILVEIRELESSKNKKDEENEKTN